MWEKYAIDSRQRCAWIGSLARLADKPEDNIVLPSVLANIAHIPHDNLLIKPATKYPGGAWAAKDITKKNSSKDA